MYLKKSDLFHFVQIICTKCIKRFLSNNLFNQQQTKISRTPQKIYLFDDANNVISLDLSYGTSNMLFPYAMSLRCSECIITIRIHNRNLCRYLNYFSQNRQWKRIVCSFKCRIPSLRAGFFLYVRKWATVDITATHITSHFNLKYIFSKTQAKCGKKYVTVLCENVARYLILLSSTKLAAILTSYLTFALQY